eukprot:evm.model.scf_973.2 EVM.evm.TU.scf_973.2   scf_973:5640-12165(-)
MAASQLPLAATHLTPGRVTNPSIMEDTRRHTQILLPPAWLSTPPRPEPPPAPPKRPSFMHGDELQCIPLGGSGWSLVNNARKIKIPLTVPGYALGALQDAAVIGDPLYRENELEYRWVAKETWVFLRPFQLSEETLQHCHADLVLSGVDTVAEVDLNGTTVATLRNAHRLHRIPIKNCLRLGNNLLCITFRPAIDEAAKAAREYPYPVPSMMAPGMLPHYNFIRKAACDFGWDWGPAFAPCGIYGDVELHAYSHAYLTGFYACQDHSINPPVLVPRCQLQNPNLGEKGLLTLEIPELDVEIEMEVTLACEGVVSIQIPKVCLDMSYEKWWPHDFGSQKLYDVKLTYSVLVPAQDFDGFGARNMLTSSICRRIGIRHIELVREPLDGGQGETFFFKVNGTAMFCKGANMIPMDIIHSRPSERQIWRLVEDAKEANMNMIRGRGFVLC